MNVGELLEMLEDVDPQTELRVAHQPSWPLALTVAAVRYPGDDADELECGDHPGYCIGHTITADQADEGGTETGPGDYSIGDECEWEDEDERGDRTDKVWIVAIDHPYGESPYAPRWVFER